MPQDDPLAVLFGSMAAVKILRLFLFNPERVFGFGDIARRARLTRRTARTELAMLERAGVIERRYFYETTATGRKRRALGFTLSRQFPFREALRAFLFATAPLSGKTLLAHMRPAGRFDVVVASGVFLGDVDRRMDTLLVAKKIPEQKVERAIRGLEAALGIELKYAFLTTEEFVYRVNMRERLIRDVFDYPHELLIDRLNIHDTMRGGLDGMLV